MVHAQRTANVVHHLNPVPYRASFFREKLHLDQNEKLCMYGTVHILAVDGYSGKIIIGIYYHTQKESYCNIQIFVSPSPPNSWHLATNKNGPWN